MSKAGGTESYILKAKPVSIADGLVGHPTRIDLPDSAMRTRNEGVWHVSNWLGTTSILRRDKKCKESNVTPTSEIQTQNGWTWCWAGRRLRISLAICSSSAGNYQAWIGHCSVYKSNHAWCSNSQELSSSLRICASIGIMNDRVNKDIRPTGKGQLNNNAVAECPPTHHREGRPRLRSDC